MIKKYSLISYDLYEILKCQWVEGTPFNYRIENNEIKINVLPASTLTAARVCDDMKQRLCDMLNDLRYYDDILREYKNL